ncbi:MAG: GAF domain-containing protein [Anaerolineales bacterium]|nr:GAF domain-containing protein [Anaerolineales bacterium]
MNNRMEPIIKSNSEISETEVTDPAMARNAYSIVIMLLIATVPSIGLFLYYGLLIDAWQILAIAGILVAASLSTIYTLYLIRQGRSTQAMMIVIANLAITFVATLFFVQGLGIVIALSVFILIIAITGLAMPNKYISFGLIFGVAVGLLALLLDYIILSSERLSVPELERTTPFIVIGFMLFFIIFTYRQFNRFSLRIKIALAILITGGMIVTMLVSYGLNRTEHIVTDLNQRYEEVSNNKIESELIGIAKTDAENIDALFAQIVNDLTAVADYRASLESQDRTFGEGLYWDAETSLLQLANGQYGNPSTDIASVFVPAETILDEDLLNDLNTTAYLDFYAPNFIKSHPEIASVYYVSRTGAVTYYPNINLARNSPLGFDATQELFYTMADPQNNPQREPRWTEARQSPDGSGLITTLSIPVYINNTFRGVMSADVLLAKIAQNIANIKVGETGYSFLVDQAGSILAMPSQAYALYELQPEEIPANSSPTQSVLAKGSNELQIATARMINGETGIATFPANNSNNYIAFAPLLTPNYRLAVIAPETEFAGDFITSKNETEQGIQSTLQGIIIILIVLLVGAIAISLWVGQLITGPLVRLTQTVKTITDGDLNARANVEALDETGVLATSFNIMTEKLSDTLQSLEVRVHERTEALKGANEKNVRRATQFESIAQISRTISSTKTLDALLPQIAETISAQFNFYHVGIFLLDTRREYAVLVAANSEGGKKMLERNHRLLVGGAGIVAYVTNTGQPRIALDVGLDAAYFNNPDLPNTHSEIALPLRIGTEIFGALDVQSTEINAFSLEDVNILSTLADQVSIAIQNARSYQQTSEALAQADAASVQLSGQQWQQYFTKQTVEGYYFDGVNTNTLKSSDKQRAHSLAIPLTVRGTRVGILKLSAPDNNRAWTDDEIALAQAAAERTALALENARLLQEAQKRASKERAIGEISAKIGGLVNIENIVQTAIQELGVTMPNTNIAIQFKKDQEPE